jgi:hypothetical protein
MPADNTKIALYSITDCCGKHLVYVTIDALPDFEDEPAFEVRYDAMAKAGYSPGIVCGSCYDNAYRAKFVEWVDQHVIGE